MSNISLNAAVSRKVTALNTADSISKKISEDLDLYNITQDAIPDETTKHVKNTLFYPIAKAFLEKFPQYYDLIRTYENAVNSIPDIVGNDLTLDEYITIDKNTFVNFKCSIQNVRIYSPDSLEAYEYSNFGYVPTPNVALATKGIYSAMIIGDVHYSYSIFHKENQFESYLDIVNMVENNKSNTVISNVIPNGYTVNIPIPIGCKWCSLSHYDKVTKIKSGEEMEELNGFFIIDGLVRYIIPIYKKPFNKPIISKNNYEDQLSRANVIYTKGYEYESSYYIIGSMVIQKTAHTGRSGAQANLPDFGFSLQLNHTTMNCDANTNGKKSRRLTNFVPIKFLFAAFGCTSDEEMIKYICPQLDNFGLINTIRQACLQGYRHKEAVKNASIKLRASQEYILYAEPMTEFTAKYIIGVAILSDNTKDELLEKCNHNENEYKILVVQTVTSILNERFMPGIGEDSKVDRNTAICMEMGSIIKSLYEIGYNLEAEQSKTSLTNRRVRNGQQIAREFKAFHGVRLREIFNEVKALFMQTKDAKIINEILRNKMQIISKNISINQSKSLINSFKGTSKEQSKLRTDIVKLKNQSFVWNRLREIVISSDTNAVGADVSWEHRTVHQSELFYIDPAQTPDSGANTGRYKTPSIYTYITLSSKGKNIVKIIQENPNYITSIKNHPKANEMYVIRLNGSIIGYIAQYEPVEKLYIELMNARRNNTIENDATIILNHTLSFLAIWTDTGRLVSPFVVVKNCFDSDINNNQVKKNSLFSEISCTITPKQEFKDWLMKCSEDIGQFDIGIQKGFIEYLDPEMAITNMVISPSLKELYENPAIYTHCALPNHIYGCVAALVPAISLNTAVRAAYSTNHVKQAIGPVLQYPQLKYIDDNNILISPQVPLVRPCTYNYLHMNEKPVGQNVIVAFIMNKYNQEDSVILNRGSVERGLIKIDSLCLKEHKIDHNNEEFKVPSRNVVLNGHPDSYSKLDPLTALPKRIGETFFENDALIGRVNVNTDGEVDTSILNDRPDGKYPISATPRPIRCIVKNKFHMDNKVMKKVMFGQYRAPIVGDKVNSEHAQKGTVGKIFDTKDMPYNSTGIRPDIIFNAGSVFKRKTFGHVYLPVVCKISALLGCPIDLTSQCTFRNDEDLFEILRQLGLDDAGFETMYDPETGRPYKTRIFLANHYWERQSHLVEQKLNIRNGGPRVPETQQPVKGKKHHGGQSVDRMTFDCMVASGIGEIIRDLHLNQSSKIKVGFCNKCHTTMGYYHGERKEWICPNCGAHKDIVIRDVAPASSMLMHIFNGLHIAVDYFENVPEGDRRNPEAVEVQDSIVDENELMQLLCDK